jgi:hypothetical protein
MWCPPRYFLREIFVFWGGREIKNARMQAHRWNKVSITYTYTYRVLGAKLLLRGSRAKNSELANYMALFGSADFCGPGRHVFAAQGQRARPASFIRTDTTQRVSLRHVYIAATRGVKATAVAKLLKQQRPFKGLRAGGLLHAWVLRARPRRRRGKTRPARGGGGGVRRARGRGGVAGERVR